LARRAAVFVFVVAVLGLFAWAGVYNLKARRAALQQQGQLTLTKDDGSMALDASGGPAPQGLTLRGKPAPDFSLSDTTGKKVSLAGLKGHAVVVNFWATWCGPCKQEMPWLEELSKKYAGQGLVVLGLDQDDGIGKTELAGAAMKIGVSYPILLTEEKVDKAYGGVDYLPQTFYIDKAGTVVNATAGGRPKDEIEADIQKTLAAGGA
jgi:thiol-disulfide isomerase/thioredoxin